MSNIDSGGLQKSYQAPDPKPQQRATDPYAHTVLNPDFIPTRSDLMGASADNMSPIQPNITTSHPLDNSLSPKKIAADSENVGVG